MENDLTGKLSPDGLDSAAKEGNATFKKNYVDEKLTQGTISSETAATYFTDEELKKKTTPIQSDGIPQGDLTTPVDIPTGVPIVPDKTESAPIDQIVPPIQEEIPNPINDTKLQTDQLYVNDLSRMANVIGVGKKYTPDAIKSNIDNPKFLDELFKQLDSNPRTAGEAADLRDTKHQRLLNEVSSRLGFVPTTAKMSTPELEKTIGQMDQDINTVKQWTVKQDLTYPEAMKTGEVTDGMVKAFEAGPDVAFKYFTDKIKDNPALNPYYKGLAANSLHEMLADKIAKSDVGGGMGFASSLLGLDEYISKLNDVVDFKNNNMNGFKAGQALQVDKNAIILGKIKPMIDDMYKLATAKLDQTIEEQTKLNPGSPLGGPVFNLNEKISNAHEEKTLARNAQIMLKDMERLILQFRNPNVLGSFEPLQPGEQGNKYVQNLSGKEDKFVPGQIPLGITQGVKSPLWNVESLLPLIPIIKKYQDGKDLTDVEQLALNSFSALNTANGTIPKTFAFEFGTSVYTNVQFMATLMAASPLYEGVFKVVEHSVEKGLKAVAQKEIGDMVVSKIAGGLTKSLANVTKGWLPELSGMVIGNLPVVFTQPMFYNEIVRNIVGQGPTIANFDNLNANQTDVFRNLKIDASQALKSSPLRSTWDAFRHTFVEDFTENLGTYGDKGLDLLANKVSGKYGKWFTGGAMNSTWRQKARLNGILMENMEEWIGAPLNWILGDDTETLKQQFTPRSLAMIAASVGVFTVPGYAMSKYQVYKGNKTVTELSDQAQVSMGLDKWKAFQEGLKGTSTLNSRAGFVQDFMQKNALTNEQVDMTVKYAGIATSNEIRNGAMTKAGMNAGRGDYQSLADLKLQNKLDKKSELLDLIESNPKTKEAYNALLEEYKGKIVDPNMTPDEVNKNFRQAFKDLLLHPEINTQASEITKKFNKIVEEASIQTEIQKIEKEYKVRLDALRTPEEVSTDQMVQHEMSLATQEHRIQVQTRVKGKIQGMTSSQLTERHTPIQTLLGIANSPQLRIEQIDKQLESKNLLPEKIVELNYLKDQLSKMSEERFNELKYERNYVANVNKIVVKQEQDDHIRSLVKTMSSGFIDQQGHVNTSLNHSSTIQDAFNAEDEFNRQMNAGELTDATRTKLSEAIGEIKRRYWPGLNDKKGVQITEVTDETVKPGMKVMLQSNLLGIGNDRIKIAGEVKDVNTKNGTVLIEITASNGEKSEVVFNQKMGNSGLWNLFENQNTEQQSLGQPTTKDSFTHKGKTYISNQTKLDLYLKERKDLTNRVRCFETEGLAKEALVEHRKRWGSEVLGRVAETDTHKFILRMSNPLLGTKEVLANKTKLDRLRVQNQSLIELSQPFNDWKYDDRTDEQKSTAALEFQSASEMLAEINSNARNNDFEHESKDLGNQVNYVFSAIDKIQKSRSKLDNWWKQIKDKNQFWDKVQKDLGINKQQIELIKNSNGNTIDKVLVDFLANYSQVVKIDIAKHEDLPTQHYINLSASKKYENNPDWEYQELEISTPFITPSIKGHADFSTDNGIGWVRVWVNKKTKEVHVQEIQSDLFQKGRDKKDLVNSVNINDKEKFEINGEYYFQNADKTGYIKQDINGKRILISKEEYNKIIPLIKIRNEENQFLQLLNEGGNWINFFIKSIVQDSAEKDYNKVLFPTGETAAKVEGHATLVDEINNIDDAINNPKNYLIQEEPDSDYIYDFNRGNMRPETESLYANKEDEFIKKLETYKSNLKSQGIEKLKPIESFYEIRITNTLNKVYGSDNVKLVTDEFKNQWREITIDQVRDSNPVVLEQRTLGTDRINTEIERAKVLRVMDALSRVTKVRWNMVDTDPKGEGRRGWTKGGEYFVNMQTAKMDTPIHEYAHPIMDAIEVDFPSLFDTLYKELEQGKDSRLSSIIEDVNRLYGNLTSQQKKKETIVTALGLEGELRLNLDMSPFAQAVYKIANAIRNWLQETFGRGGLTVNTTLGELSKMIVTGRVRIGEAKNNVEHEAKGSISGINFQEEQSSGYRERTIKNASTDATIAIASDFFSAGEKLTRNSVEQQNKKYIAIDFTQMPPLTPEFINSIVNQLNEVNAKTLNIAGNGIYTLKGKFTQEQIDSWTFGMLNGVLNSPNLKTKIESIRSGGQTGFDEAGAKAGIKLGLPTIILAPKGWKFRDVTGTDISNELEFKKRFDNIQVDESVIPQEPVIPSKKIETKSGFISIDRAMTVTYDEFYTLMESNADLSKYEMIQKAIVAGRKVYMTSPMYLGELDNSRRQMQLDIFENMMHKMLKKKKIVTDDEGKSVEMDNFEGPAATSEDKFEQFKSGFSKVISALSKKTTLPKDVIERNLVDMTKPEFFIQNRKQFNDLTSGYTDENHINISKAITDTMTYEDYNSLQNFYGSVHFEEQYGIELSIVNGEMKAIDYKQSISATDSSLHSVFDEHIKSMNQHDLVRISKVYDDFRKFNTSRVGNFIINQEFLDKTRNMLMVLTGFNEQVIDSYLSSPRLVGDKLFYYKNEKFVPVPYGSNLTQLLGERLYYRDKFGKEQLFKYVPVLSAFGFEVHNNGDQISKQLIQGLFNKKKGGYSNIDIILMAHAKSNTDIGMSGTDIEGNRFGTMTLAHQLYNQSLKLVDKLKNTVMQSYYKDSPMKIQKFNGFRNTETGNNFTGTKLDGDALWFGLIYMYRNGGQKDYQHFLGQFSDKTSIYTGNAPKWEGKTNWSKASQFNSNLLKDAQYIEKLINQYRTELSFEETDTEGMKDLARDFAVSFSINSGNILPALHGTHTDFIDKTTKKFSFDDMIKRAQVVISPGYQIVTEVEGGLKSKLRYVIANEKLIKTLQGIDHKILDGLNFMSEDAAKRSAVSMGSIFAREKEFGKVDMIKAVVTGVDENRILIKSNILNIGVLKGLYGENDIHTQIADYMFQHKIDFLSFPSSAKKYDKTRETALFNKTDQNLNKIIPKVIKVNLSDFYIQQDLRHEVNVSPYDLPNQLYSNIVTLNSFKDMIVQISHLTNNSHDFVNKMFSGFKDITAIQQYLLMNVDIDKDGQEFYDMISNWAISDPAFRAKLTSKLINLVNRDVLELNVPRQSSIEIPDTEGQLLGLRKDTMGHVLLPEIGVNIPGIRYAKDKFKTYEDAVQWMQSNDRKLLDLKNNDGSLQLWQVYQDSHTDNWIVPGQPILSTRVPAGDLHSHTVARARYKINSTSALTMIDMQSQINSGSDNDGDARYNWVLTNDGEYIVNDDSYHGSVNKLLLNLVDEYQSVDNFDKINNPINTEAFDTIIEDIMKDYHNPDQIDENSENSILAQRISRKKNMTGSDLKGIITNLTSAFSYLKAFNVKSVVEDKFNVVKAAFEDILNLALDNAKDPKIEKLGINQVTAQMVAYELITNKDIDKAKTREDALRIINEIVSGLAKKYSPYSSTKNSIISEYLQLIDTESGNLKREKKSGVLDQIRKNHLQKNSKGEMVPDQKYNDFMKIYQGGQSLELIGRIRKIRDGLPNRLSDFLSLKNTMMEFVHGKDGKFQHFFFEDNLYGQNTNNPVFDPNYKAFSLARNIFSLNPGSDVITHLDELFTNSFDIRNALTDSPRSKKRLKSNFELSSLASMADFEYLMKLRDQSYVKTESLLTNEKNGVVPVYQRAKNLTAEERATKQSYIANDNRFLDLLDLDHNTFTNKAGNKKTTTKIKVNSYTGNTKLNPEDLLTIQQDFAKLPFNLRRALAYYTIVNYGTTSSLRGGGFFGLIDPQSRIDFTQLQYTTPENAAMSMLLYKQMEAEIKRYADQSAGITQTEDQLDEYGDLEEVTLPEKALKNLRTILREEKLDLNSESALAAQNSFTGLLDMLNGTISTDARFESGLIPYMNRLGIKSREELVRTLEKIQSSDLNMKYQFNVRDKGTSIVMQDPALFAFMFDHFKKTYPELSVFNNVQEFLDFIQKNTGRTMGFDLDAIGAAFANAIYINIQTAQQDTFFHEHAHIYWDAIPVDSKEKNRLRSLYGWTSSMNSQERERIDEMIIQDIGVVGTGRAELRFEGNRLGLFLDYLRQFWNQVRSMFSLTQKPRKQAEMYFLQQIVADQVWSGGKYQSEIANTEMMHYQNGVTGDYWGTGILDIGHKGIDYSTVASLEMSQSDIFENKRLEAEQSIENIEKQIQQNEINFVQLDKIDANVFVSDNSRMYYRLEDGRVLRLDNEQKVLDRESLIDQIMQREERFSIRHAAIANMVQWAAEDKVLQPFKFDNEEVYLGDLFSDPIATFEQIKTIVQNTIHEQFGVSKIEVGKVVYDDQAKHLAQMDLVGRINPQGDMIMVKFLPTIHSLEVEPGRFSPEYTNTHGRFRPNTPLEKVPNNLEQKVKNSLSQFAYMYDEMAKQSGEQKQITRSVVIPLVLTEGGLHVTDVKEESSIEYNYTLQDKLLAQEMLQFAINDKMFNQAFNPVSEQELAEYKMQKRATAQEQDFADTQAKGPHIVAAFTARSGNVLSAWNVAVNSNLGHGSWLNTALNQLGWRSFMVTNKKGENKSSTKQRDFTLSKLIKGKLNDDGSPRGSVLYMSPGSGKTFAAENHIKLYDSDEILEHSLLTGYYDYLTKDSVTGKMLHTFSDSHPVLKTTRLFGKGSDGETAMTFKSILDDYHTGKISLNLFAFQMSSLIHELRMIAARELKVDSSGSKEQMRSETSELSGEAVDMIRLNTPYEVLTERIDDANKAGYHVLTSTLMHPEFKYLIDLSFDSVNLLRDDVKNKKGFGLMQYRTMSHQRKNVIAASDQKWNETRYKLENETFASNDNVHYTDRYATDVLFEQPFHSFKEKIAGLKSLYAISKLGITYNSYRQKLDQSFNESIVNGDREKAQENLSLTMEEFINQKWKERFPNYDENGRTAFSYAQLETLMKNNNLAGDPYSLLGFLHNGGISEDQVVDKFIDNISLADKLWEEVGTMESFADRFDYANAKTDEDKMFIRNSLIELMDRIKKLDLFNGEGLMHLVTSQNAINDLLAAVELESKEGGVNRPNTTLLGKILTHPDFKWIPGVDYEKMMFYKIGLHKIFKPQGKIGRLFKLDRLIDKRHTLLQQLMIRQQVAHNTIVEESNTTMQDLSSKFRLMSAYDKEQLTYKYGSKDEDRISSMFGRTAYIGRQDALVLRGSGHLSQPAFDYLEQLREQFDKYDFKYHKQRMKYGDDVPMFMPDVQAQLEPMSVAEFVSQDSEFARLVNTYYGIDVNGPTNRKFRRELYNAMNVSGEDSFVVQATANTSTGQSPDGKTYDELKDFKQFDGMTFADVKRALFDPRYIGREDVMKRFENSIDRLEKIRNMVSKTATAKYMKKERTLHQSGAFNKGMILRTEMFHEANLIYLNSLISNFHTKTLAPFAQFVEDRYKSDAAKSVTYDEAGKPLYHDNYMQDYITSYIDERVFKHTPEDMVQFKKVHRIVGSIVSLAGLGLNLGGAVGNFTAGQMQNFMGSPDAYWKGFKRLEGLTRLDRFKKAINIMHHSNVGMVVDDVTFKRSEKFMEGLMRTGMFFTTNVEDVNQGILFLGSMTDEEFSWYGNDGIPLDPNKKMSHFRTIQIENELRRIHGDYGHNRPLYGANPWLMEMGRFKMGWMQTLLNDYWGGTSVDIFNQEHRSVRQSVFNSYNRFIVHVSTVGFNGETRIAKKMKMLENVLNSGGTDDVYARLKDSVEESVESVYDGMEHRSALEYRTFPLEVPDPNDPTKTVKKWLTVTDNDYFTTKAKMVIELLMDHEQQKNFLNKDRVDSENYRRLHRMLGLSTLGTIGGAMAYMTMVGLMSGAGGDPDKKEMSWEDWGHAFAYGFKSEGILGSVKKVLSGQTATSLKDDQMAHPLTSFSSFSSETWRGISRMKMFMNFGKQINSDILIPYNPVQLSKFVTPSAAATAGMVTYAAMLVYSSFQDIAPIFSLEAPVLHHFDTINLQAGYNTEMTKTPFYLRKVLPMKWAFQWMYNQQHIGENWQYNPDSWNRGAWKGIEYSLFNYPSQQMFEDSQVFLRTMSQMNSFYDMAVGAGYIAPEQIPELSKVVQQMVKAKYYNNLEWRKAQGMQPITEMKDKGKFQINKKQREKLWNALHGK